MRTIKALATHLALAAASLCLWPGVGGAQPGPAPAGTVLVIDGSGSMWGELGSERGTKLEHAQEALRQSLVKLQGAPRLGLISFGHRRRADCSDVEVMAPLEGGPAQRILALTDKLNPRGKGPLASALREGAKLVPEGAAASMIVMHDGPDNCSQDPCAVASEIAKANPTLSVHVISIGLDKADVPRVACVPRLTNGRYYEASDRAGVIEALAAALDLASLDDGSGQPLVEAAPKASQKPAPGLRLTVGLAKTGAALSTPVRWTIKTSERGEIIHDVMAPSVELDVPPGRYDVLVEHGLARAASTVDVTADGPTTARLSLDAGILKLSARANKNGDTLAAPLITIARIEGEVPSFGEPLLIGRNPDAEIVLPAGRFGVRVEDGVTVSGAAIATVQPGRLANVDINLGAGLLELSAQGLGGVPVSDVLYTLSEDDPDAPQGRREVARSADANAGFRLPAGTYYLTARYGAAEKRDLIAINSGDVVRHAVMFDVGRLSVATTRDASLGRSTAPTTVRVFSSNAPQREVARSSLPDPVFLLPPQRYRVEAQAGDENVRVDSYIDLLGGRETKVTLKLEVGELTIDPGGAQRGLHTRWRVKNNRGRTVLHSGAGGLRTARLAPGRYVVQSDGERGALEQVVDLAAGEQRVLKLPPP